VVSRLDIGEPDLWDAVDEAIDRIQEPLEVPGQTLLNASEES
jgi:hypothetical protein